MKNNQILLETYYWLKKLYERHSFLAIMILWVTVMVNYLFTFLGIVGLIQIIPIVIEWIWIIGFIIYFILNRTLKP